MFNQSNFMVVVLILVIRIYTARLLGIFHTGYFVGLFWNALDIYYFYVINYNYTLLYI